MHTFQEMRKIVTEELNYELSRGVLWKYRRQGFLKPSETKHVEFLNRTMPMYTDEDIKQFIAWYKAQLASKATFQIRRNKRVDKR